MDFSTLINRAWATEQLELQQHIEEANKRKRYLEAEPQSGLELPELPEGTEIHLMQFGIEIILPAGTDLAPYNAALLAAGYDRQEHAVNQLWRGEHVKAADATGHDVVTWYYHTVNIRTAREH